MRDGWRKVSLGSVIERRTDFVPVVGNQEYTILGVQRSGWGFVERDPIKGSDQKFSKLMRLRENDLVYRTITAFEAPAAVVGPAEAGRFVTPQTFPVFHIDQSQMLPGYMKALTTWPTFHEEMSSRCTGSVLRRKTLSIAAFESIPIALPSLQEQRRIVDLLGALDHSTRAEELRLKRTRSGLAKTMNYVSRYPEVDAKRVRIGDVATVERKSVSPNAMPNAVRLYSIPGLDAGNAPEVVPATSIGSNKFLIQQPSLLISMLNPRIHRQTLAEPNSYCSTEFAIVVPADADVRLDYLAAVTRSTALREHLIAHAKGTTGSRSRSKATDLLGFEIALPSQETQAVIAGLAASFDQTISAIELGLKTNEVLRSNLLTALLSGEHEIPDTYDKLMEELAA